MVHRHHTIAVRPAVLTRVVVPNQDVLLRQRDLLHRPLDVVQHADNRGHSPFERRGCDRPVASVDQFRFAGKNELDGALKARDVQRLVRKV